MKTCAFRGAHIRSRKNGLFYADDHDIEALYSFKACGYTQCSCCHPLNTGRTNHSWAVIDFNSSSIHHFLNGYTTILNCPAVSHSSI